ncbi:unnamed protein product, partial [Staurois parvus]
CQNTGPAAQLFSAAGTHLFLGPALSAVSGHLLYCVHSLWSSPVLCPQSLVISCTVSTVSGPSPIICPQSLVHLLYCVCSHWSSPVPCPQSLVISCTVRSLWSSPVLCPQSVVISCTVCSLWSSPVICPQCLVTSCTVSAVHWFRIFFFLIFSSKT